MAAEPIRHFSSRGASPLEEIRAQISALADMLLEQPRPDRSVLRPCAKEIYDSVQRLSLDQGLLQLVLRNLLRDLVESGAAFDPAYHANQLVRAADQIGSR